MAEIRIEIKSDDFSKAKQMSDEAVARALEQCGALWESEAKQMAPVDTGRLRNSIEHHPEGTDTMVVETDVEYAVYQEMGTRYQTGTPFMQPSGEKNIGTFQQIFDSELQK